jgi:hypothetical protein
MGTSMRFVIAIIKHASWTTFKNHRRLRTYPYSGHIRRRRWNFHPNRSTSVARGVGIALPNFMSERNLSTSGTKRVADESDSNAGRANTWLYPFFSG